MKDQVQGAFNNLQCPHSDIDNSKTIQFPVEMGDDVTSAELESF